MTENYIELLVHFSQDIYKLPKLSKECICLEKIQTYEKIFLFGFYEYYKELDKFNIKELNFAGIYHLKKNILTMAASYNKIRLIKYLLARGININISTQSKMNAYLYALTNSNVKIKTLKLLEDNGANIHKITYNNNAFLLALRYNKRQQNKVLEYLKSRGINIHIINSYGGNAYFYIHNIKIFKYLEENGVNIHIKDSYYNINIYTYFIRILTNSHTTLKMLKYLKSRGVNTYYSDNYSYCKRLGDNNILKHLLISNSNIRYKNIICYI